MRNYERVEGQILEEIADIVSDIGADIRLENYNEAGKKINLLSKLLKTLNEGNRK
jgi:hypothetical protein